MIVHPEAQESTPVVEQKKKLLTAPSLIDIRLQSHKKQQLDLVSKPTMNKVIIIKQNC